MTIKLENVTKRYDKTILNNINLNIKGYKSVAIIGKSGCGKSTLLRLLSGIEACTYGLIRIKDTEITETNIKTFQKKIGIVFQQHNLFPHISVLKNITLILEKTRGHSNEQAEKKAITLLNRLHLHGEIHKLPPFISGGQAQRASIARALSTDPDILFLDEPTAALDPILSAEVLDSILELKESGTTFIFVTHEIDFVRNFADYIVFMDQGEIVEEGPVEILNNPKTGILKSFVKKVEK